jgi:uncharacterized protein YecE (DUF72 family)
VRNAARETYFHAALLIRSWLLARSGWAVRAGPTVTGAGHFYPDKLAAKRWFAYYAETFGTVELNTSFYHLPTPQTFGKWRDQAPPGFRYAVKAPRFITHMKKLEDCAEPVGEFIGRARNLGETLGPLLYQLPPRWAFNRERLETFLDHLPHDLQHVLEFGNAVGCQRKSWRCSTTAESDSARTTCRAW